MSLTLGLNTALSGLLTSQRGLDVIAQNVSNVNTVGYTRKVLNQEARIVGGVGAGVQEGSLTRMAHEGLLKDIRRQNSELGRLEAEQTMYPRIDDLFGEVEDDTSIAHRLSDLMNAFESLSTQSDKSSTQWNTVQKAQDVSDSMQDMTRQIQNLRLEADNQIDLTVDNINRMLDDINDLNQKIVKHGTIATGTADLEDQRDVLLTELSKSIDIQYFKRQDNSVSIFTNSGEMLLDNQVQHLSYTSSTVTAAWMTSAGGQFGKITAEGSGLDLTNDLTSGQIRAFIKMRDEVLPQAQSMIDEMAKQLHDNVNQIHNRGTSLPNISSSYNGTRAFASQGDIVNDAADAVATMYRAGGTVTHGGLAFAAGSGSYPWQATLTATNAVFTAADFPAGTVFTLSGTDTARNAGTYRVVERTDNWNVVVEKVNPRQTIQLDTGDDVVLGLFDTSGDQIAKTTLNTIMQVDYQATAGLTPGTGRNVADFDNRTDHGDWSINEVTAHIEGWLKAEGYSNASVNLNSDGKLDISVGDTTVSLAFRDQGSSTDGADQADAKIFFDATGDGATDQTVSGFSNFFGLNDFYVKDNANSIHDSAIQDDSFTTSTSRTLSLWDSTGQIGPEFTVAANSSLSDIADSVNRYGRVTESARLSTTSWTTTSAATVTIADPSGTLFTQALPAGAYTVEALAGLLNQSSVTATVVVDGAYKRLRLTDSRGEELTATINGGDLSTGSDLGTTLEMSKEQKVYAAVVPDGSGSRLRIIHSGNQELFLSSDLDGQGKNLLSDLSLEAAATTTAAGLAVRQELVAGPERISRGMMQWNSDVDEYFISEGDNAVALQMAELGTTKLSFDSAGGLFQGQYTLSEYAAATISVVAGDSDHSKTVLDYQSTLSESLDFQYTSFSGVNLDEEVSAMIDYQQAYTASAKVITAIQEMLEVLVNIIQ
ncbi:flagellar hook-associated protein FlgK [Magnetospirillum moscoviense]|uniref:flagellar hook-associated protein FlgK n=1 Tax=Magnetospirillum moscoviense TaxID=1437059 RepID=UPI0009ED5BC5|nr:flagellar hook-associated protein FlgK [Magnetospirillum moscoviense]